jgi:uncharacterized protein (DUF1499 family)
MVEDKLSGVTMAFSRFLLYSSLITAFIFMMSGYGYQWRLWELGVAFLFLRYSAYAAIALAVVSLVSLWFLRKSKSQVIFYAIISLILSGIVGGSAFYWQQRAQSVPPIHDITTDLVDPPEFVAMVRLRTDAPNPPEYAGEETRQAQIEAYPEVKPLMLEADLQDVMDFAVMMILQRNWDLVAINRNQKRIEATEKLAWFGFKDDVVLRFTEMENGGTRVDMRSKSRIGRSDVGVNAKRINRFLTDLEQSLGN